MGRVRFKGSASGKEYRIEETADQTVELKDIDDNLTLLKADSTTLTDASGVQLSSHGSRHARGGTDPINDENITNLGDSDNVSCAIGLNNTPTRTVLYKPPTNFYNALPMTVLFDIGGTFATGETITISVKVILDSGDEFEIGSLSVTATGTQTVDAGTIWSNLLSNAKTAGFNR